MIEQEPICVAALYRFTPFDDCPAIKAALAKLCCGRGVRGLLLIAHEGINGTIAGSDEAIAAVLAHIRTLPGCSDIEVKYARAAAMPFHRMKVRIKHEIVTMGQPDIDPLTDAGHYVAAGDWNALIADPDTIVIDTRNDYEVAVGTFAGAINPGTTAFADFPDWFQRERATLLGDGAPRKVAMFCTGGIRCEKSTAYLKAQGVEQVYHLEGGILKYLETVSPDDSLWQGECFVFDQRVTVGNGLAPGTHLLCHACRRPVSQTQASSPLYEAGVSCPACHHERSDAQRAGYRERHRQQGLAERDGQTHIGAAFAAARQDDA
ncbi:MAG: rhodanese-related sulfurtransferase [Sphingomonadaceae bacterium]|nr:rhodanese-related sulfurtransferase [Sphingomonadaceae bacterium]